MEKQTGEGNSQRVRTKQGNGGICSLTRGQTDIQTGTEERTDFSSNQAGGNESVSMTTCSHSDSSNTAARSVAIEASNCDALLNPLCQFYCCQDSKNIYLFMIYL